MIGRLAITSRRSLPVELTNDRQFAGRITRLALTSVVALGLIWLLARTTTRPGLLVDRALLAGWILMPVTLGFSLRWPLLRYALAVPSSLVSLPLLIICATPSPAGPIVRLGWAMTTAGVWLGGFLGIWFWFRWLPVPTRFADPFSSGRWTLVGIHVGLITVGVIVVMLFGW